MTNPAAELADLLSSWNLNANHPVAARGGDSNGSVGFWRSQGHAVTLLLDIDRALESLRLSGKSTDGFEASVADWYRAVFSFVIPWNQGTQGATLAIESASLNSLRGFALVLDMMGDSPSLSASQRELVADQLAVVLALLESDLEGLDSSEREYVTALVLAIRDILDFEGVLAGAELKTQIDQLNGALIAMSAQLDAVGNVDDARSVIDVVRTIIAATRTLAYDGAALAAIVTAVPVVQKMITG